MTDNTILTPPGGPASLSHGQAQPRWQGTPLLIAVLIVAASVIVGLAAGAIWAVAAPRVLYQVYTLRPPTAYATNPETSAFIAADGWYCIIALAGGALIGLLGYLFGVRRYGPAPMVGIVVGSVAAGYVAAWLGHLLSGGAGFDHVLATSRPGMFLHAPISLGSNGAHAFWPLAAAGVAGGIVLVGVLKDRNQRAYEGVPMPGLETFSSRPLPTPPGADGPSAGRNGSGQQSASLGHDSFGAPGGADAPGGANAPGGADAGDGGPGRGAP